MMAQSTSILAEFDDDTQEFLKFVDSACTRGIDMIGAEMRRCKLKDEEFEITPEVMATINMIRGFGILYNRCIDAGWIDGVHMTTPSGGVIV
jgi:hypothetical protein